MNPAQHRVLKLMDDYGAVLQTPHGDPYLDANARVSISARTLESLLDLDLIHKEDVEQGRAIYRIADKGCDALNGELC